MSRTISGTYTSTQLLSTPATDNPATVTSTGVVQVTDADGIYGSAGYPWTLTNLGTIALLGTTGNGVHLAAGGTVTNGQTGSAGISITAPEAGVKITGAAGTVQNFGRITGPTATGVGVMLEAGGSVTNGAIGAGTPLISGAYTGIAAATGPASIVNFGRIEAPGTMFDGGRAANVAVFLGAGGIVQNGTEGATGAQIEGYHMGVFSGPLDASITVSNFGTIKASATHHNSAAGASGPEAGVAILLGAPDPVIRNGSSTTTDALIQGYYRAIGTGYYGTATIVNFGTIESTQIGLPVRYFGTAIVLHNGSTVTNYGLIKGAQNGVWASPGATLGAPGTIDNFGTIEATSGFARINGSDLLPTAVTLFNGGTVNNEGLIRSGWDGVVLTNTAGSVINTGTIQSLATDPSPAGVRAAGVALTAGGIVINGANGAADALIEAHQTGVFGSDLVGNPTPQTATVINYGMIAGIGSTTGNGVVLAAGGTVSNSGTISSAAVEGFGVTLGGAGSLTNTAGALITSAGAAVSIGGPASTGVSVTNSGNITGNVGIVIAAGDTGSNTIVNDGTITGTSGIAIDLGDGTTEIVLKSDSQLDGSISKFDLDDTLSFPDIPFDDNGSVSLDSDKVLHIAANGSTFSVNLDPSEDFTGLFFDVAPDGSGGTLVTQDTVPCFCRGTLILTDRGEVPVEELAVGDRVTTLSGGCKPIIWIGFGRDLVTRANRLARPIIVRRGALADDVPRRDLYLTHGHALYLNGVLIPVEHLVNHRSIAWDDTARVVEYYHIELQDHDVLLAEGAPTESYYEASNRALFQNTRKGSVSGGIKPTCVPVLNGGEIVGAVWAALFARAGGQIDANTTDDADLHLVLDGKRINPAAIEDDVYRFVVERPPARHLSLCSRSAVPSLLGVSRHDHRPLGVAIKQVVLHHAGIPTYFDYDTPQFREGGCHLAEDGHCWTDGEFELPARFFTILNGGFTLVVHTKPHYDMRYPISPQVARAA